MRTQIEDGFTLDSEAVYDLIQSVYRSTDLFVADFEQEYPSLGALSDRFREIRTRPGSLFLVARNGHSPLGYLSIVPRTARKLRHTADLNMGVREEARGQGIGDQLLNAALSLLQSRHTIEIVYLMVRADNHRALQLYKKHGFEVLATLTQDIKIGARYHDGVLMRRHVSHLL
jgi:ribosomal protein S18 acetylase RimI-like enzyme